MTREIRHIVIHCSATPDGWWFTAEAIDRWHGDRGFERREAACAAFNPHLVAIGYHYVIKTNGVVDTGRHEDEIGAHVAGSNAHSIGVCMIGTGRYTRAQWDALAHLVTELRGCYPDAEVCGHRDCSPDADGDGVVEPWEWLKTCPGFDVAGWLCRGMTPEPANRTEAAA